MNRHILLLILALLLTVSTQAQDNVNGDKINAQQIVNRKYVNGTFHDVSLAAALSQLAEQQTDYTIMFLYNELEDFRITTTVSHKTLPDAIQQMIGFYPIRMTVDKSTPDSKKIFVECTHKTDRHLTGTVIDEQGKSVAYANVALLNPADSTLLGGGVSNESGVFVIPYEQPQVLARISYIGYKTIYKICNDEDAGTIQMEPDTYVLKTVNVNGERQIVKAENGHLTYNMPLLLDIFPADNAYEALTRIPGVIDTGSGLSFTGSTVTLIINGKPTTLNGDDVSERLRQMPATMVAKAEVLPSAPAKYHVRGMAINIITKDFAGTYQASGQLQGIYQQGKYAYGQGTGSMIVQHGQLGIDASYTYGYGDAYGKVEHSAHHPLGTERVYYNDKTERRSTNISHNYRVGMDYAFAGDHRLNIVYTGKWSSADAINISTGLETAVQKSKVHNYVHNVDASYSAPFGLQLGASYTNYQNPRTQHLDSRLYAENRNLTAESRQRIGKWLFTADQSHDLGRNWQLNYGLSYQLTRNESFQTTLNESGHILPDATSHVDYEEQILNVYAGFSKQLTPTISLDASLASEHYHTPRDGNDWQLFPVLNLMWNVNTQNMLNLSFSSETIYPSYWSTMSSIFYSSAYSEIWGNPDLKPFSHYDIDLTWQAGQHYTFSAFVKLNPDYSVQLAYQPSDRMAVIMKETNFDHSNTYGMQASARFKAGWWLNGTLNATGFYRTDKSSQFFDLPFNRSKITALFSLTASARLSKRHDIKLILTPTFQSRAIQGVYDIDPLFRLNAGLRWTSADTKWSIVANGQNIMANHIDTHSHLGNQDYTMRVWMPHPNATLAVVYRIGGFKEKKHKEVDTSRMGY